MTPKLHGRPEADHPVYYSGRAHPFGRGGCGQWPIDMGQSGGPMGRFACKHCKKAAACHIKKCGKKVKDLIDCSVSVYTRRLNGSVVVCFT
jgi:hypothetical protein